MSLWFKKEPTDVQMREIQKSFRRVFNSQDGRIVLGVMLEDLHFFSPCDTVQAQELRNYATILLNRCGALQDTIRTVDVLIDSTIGE